jgi:CRISPR-associated endonuclease/helicase Cas3
VPEKILAKSPMGGREITLSEHVATVRDAAEYLFGSDVTPTKLGEEWIRFFKLQPSQFRVFLINLKLAAIFHDLGKANDGFQKVIRKNGTQAIRHEHLSALLLHLEPMRMWLSGHSSYGVDVEIVISAVLSHHLKANDVEFGKRLEPGIESFRVFTRAPEFLDCLYMASEMIGSEPPDLSSFDRQWSFEADVDPFKGPRGSFGRSMQNFKRSLSNEERRRLLVAVKAGLLAADSAGSALVREGQSLSEWISVCFRSDPLTPDWLEEKVIIPRIKEVEGKSGQVFRWHDFQKAAADLDGRALLLSGCGTGKTLAAWRWIKSQLGRRFASRVLFLYPTRGTATEGFRDYVSWAGGEDAALLHGTAAYDLSGIFANPGDPRHGGDYHVAERLFALGYWPKRIFSATVDSFLAFMRNQYASLCLLPVLADSVVVIDEVHSFDKSMFSALERFLKFFDIPVLCMTASLPSDRLEVLRDSCGLMVFPQAKEPFEDLKKQAEVPRYHLTTITEEEAERLAIRAYHNSKKVLWVTNSVRRCQQRALGLRTALGHDANLLCYHSRFRLCDRRDRHGDVVQRFQREIRDAVIAVTTQVCEMSLDLDADVLITEIAPVPSLIQRMGRCCREPIPSSEREGKVFIYPPSDYKPYEKREIAEGTAFVKALMEQQRRLTHADLGDYLANMDVFDPFIEGGFNGFLDAGPYAMSSEETFREGNDFTVDCVLDNDVEMFLAARRSNNPTADGLIVPVPKRFARDNVNLGRFLREASAVQYDKRFGFLEPEEVAHVRSDD